MKKSRKVIYIGKFKQAILMVLLLFSLGFVQAQDVLLDKQIKLTEFQGTIKEALDEISKSGGFYFSYSSDINTDKWIEIKSKQQSVREYLDELFDENKVKYVEKRNKIFILPINRPSFMAFFL